MTVAGLLLAAGGGRRLGGPKALVEHDGELLVERGARLLASAGLDPVVVVIGARYEEVVRRARLGRARVVVNRHWAEGIGSSLRAGLAALAGGDDPAEAVVVALADQPLVAPAALQRLVDAWRNGSLAVVASFGGEPRNPVLLDRSLWTEVEELAVGDVGARGYLRRHPGQVTSVPCDDVGSALDIDTPQDLAALAEGEPKGASWN